MCQLCTLRSFPQSPNLCKARTFTAYVETAPLLGDNVETIVRYKDICIDLHICRSALIWNVLILT
jgi:hypothetical protein